MKLPLSVCLVVIVALLRWLGFRLIDSDHGSTQTRLGVPPSLSEHSVSQVLATESSDSVFNLTRKPSQIPEGIRVKGFPYLMRSPHDKDSPLIDFTGLDPGTAVECSSTGRLIRVPNPTAEERAIAEHRKTLKETKLAEVQVDSRSFEDAATWLGEYTNIPIILDRVKITEFAPQALKTPITLNLVNLPAYELLRFVSEFCGVPYKLTADGVLFTMDEARLPPPPPNTNMFTKPYKRPAHLPKPKPDVDLLDMMRHHGVDFPKGASVSYNVDSDQYVIRNTKEQMKRMDAVIDGQGSF